MSSKIPESENLIDNFIDELWLEKGLSKNTLSAYRQDISSFNKWLRNISLIDVTKVELLDYLAYRLKRGYSSRSTARSLSSLRALYNHLSNKYNLKEKVENALEEIRPFLKNDGGDISLIEIKNNTVKVRLEGACTSCSVNQMTLKTGVEMTIKKHAPEIQNVVNVGI